VIAASALVLTATAASAAPTKKEVFDIFDPHFDCGRSPYVTEAEQDKACKAEERAIKKLNAQGYFTYGHIAIGRNGRPWNQKEWERTGGAGTVWPEGRKHCYYLKEKRDARMLQYIEEYNSKSESEKRDQRRKARCKKHPTLPACEENNGLKGDAQ